MSETLRAVIVTGVLTLVASTLAQLLAGRTSRRIASDERRHKVAEALRPMTINAIDAIRNVVVTTRTEHGVIEAIWEQLRQNPETPPHETGIWREDTPTFLAAAEALQSAESAIVELVLSIQNARASEALTNVLDLLRAVQSNTTQFRLEVTDPNVAMGGQDAWTAVNELERAIPDLTYAMQPLTAISPARSGVWARLQSKRLRGMSDALERAVNRRSRNM